MRYSPNAGEGDPCVDLDLALRRSRYLPISWELLGFGAGGVGARRAPGPVPHGPGGPPGTPAAQDGRARCLPLCPLWRPQAGAGVLDGTRWGTRHCGAPGTAHVEGEIGSSAGARPARVVLSPKPSRCPTSRPTRTDLVPHASRASLGVGSTQGGGQPLLEAAGIEPAASGVPAPGAAGRVSDDS
jgi:hypothetical protein